MMRIVIIKMIVTWLSLFSLPTSALKVEFSAARIKEFHAFVQDGRSYEKLVQAFAPSIW